MKTWEDVKIGEVILVVFAGHPYEIVKVGENSVYFTILDVAMIHEGESQWEKTGEITDWLEDSADEQPHLQICTCDLFTVLMRSGCQCGGR